VSTLLKLRDYQDAAITALMKGFDSGDDRLAVVVPTGGGKTVIFSHLSDGYVTRSGGRRVLILAHTDELVRQAAKKLHDVAPHLKVGIVKANVRETTATVIVASVQSLRDARRRDEIKNVGLVIVDECHHATAKTYRDILTHYGCFEPSETCPVCEGKSEPSPEGYCEACHSTGAVRSGALAAGFTATLMRGDKASLAEVWQKVAYRKDISFMIRRGYLIEPRGKRVEVDDLDLSKVKKSGGDYQAGDLGAALEASLAPEVVAKAYVEHASDRAGILFAPTVEAAYTFADELNVNGIKTETIHGALPTEERRDILRRFDAGEIQVISNCMVLTEGFDAPRVSCVVIARPTKSAPLYQQMVGRGLRPDPTRPREGQDCLILDVVGASHQHGLASLIDLSERKLKELGDGQGLIEAEDALDALEAEEEAGANIPDTFFHDGPTVAVDFDPLADASSRLWLKTTGGTWFLSAGAGPRAVYVFLTPAAPSACPDVSEECLYCDGTGVVAPAPGTWDVVWSTKTAYDSRDGKRGDVTEHRGIGLELAFSWGEDVAVEMGGETGSMTLNKKASWRRGMPSDKQLTMCRQRGIEVPEGATKGDVSTLIDTHMASKRIDPIAAFFAKKAQEG
jgi:superfamily II DNA or RNA helicase